MKRAPPPEMEWLSDNGPGYTTENTRRIRLGHRFEASDHAGVQSTEHSMAESFVTTMKRDLDGLNARATLSTAGGHKRQK
jgi:putative transposase